MEVTDQSAPEVGQDQQGSEETQDQGLLDNQPELDADGNPVEQEDDGEEIEHEGEKYRIPKKLKDAFLKNADYTQKTQTLAEQRREFEAGQARFQQEQQAFAEMNQRQQQLRPAYARLDGIDQQLQQYQGVNWQQLDPQVAQQHWMTFQQLKEQRQNLAQGISQAEQQHALDMQRMGAQQLQQADQQLAREIKDWSPETKAKLRDYGKSIGLTEDRLSRVQDPIAIKMLHKAMLYDQHVANATKKPPAGPPAAPLKVVKSGSASVANPDNMSMEQYAEYERKRMAKKRP